MFLTLLKVLFVAGPRGEEEPKSRESRCKSPKKTRIHHGNTTGGVGSTFNTNVVTTSFIAFDEGECMLISPMPCSVERFASSWLTITIVSTSCATVSGMVANMCFDVFSTSRLSYLCGFRR